MNIELWITFIVASSVLLIIPGPTILTVISYSISHGHRVKIPLITGASLLSIAGIWALTARKV